MCSDKQFKKINTIKSIVIIVLFVDVNDEFPTENKQGNFKHYFNYNTADGSFRHCECGNDPNNISLHANCYYNKRKFVVIWRKL